LHPSTGLFISFPISSHAFYFLTLLQCIGCFGSHIISFPISSHAFYFLTLLQRIVCFGSHIISFPISFHAFYFLTLLQCIRCFGSHIISFPISSHAHFLILLQCIGCFESHIIPFLLQSLIYSRTLSSVHSISQLPNPQETAKHYRFAPLFKIEASGKKRRGEMRTVVTCHIARSDLLRP
jgi:hypothetical protein